jgi:hypothetical protein
MRLRVPKEGESIVKIRTLSFLAGGFLALVTTVLLSSCGGGGAAGNPAVTGTLQITPSVGTIYAGVPFTFQILGGRKPYALTSSEPGLAPVPSSVDGNSFTVLAGNPGVVDIGQQPGQLPSRTTHFTVRSGDGQTADAKMDVGQNFLTGYGISISPITCPLTLPAGSTVAACAGGEAAIRMSATFNGAIFGDRPFRFEVMKGHFQFVFPPSGVLGNTVTTTSDHGGTVLATIKIDPGIATEIGVIRVIDVGTGVYEDHAFVIQGSSGNGALSAVPTSITLTGNLTTDCGQGQETVFIFDGAPPYNAFSSNPSITVTPSQSTTNPGQFTITVNAGAPPCPTGTVVVTDSSGSRATIDVTSKPGAGSPPTPAAFTVAPNAIVLGCGQSGSVSAVGGSGSYSTNSGSPNVTAVVSGNTVTITRANSGTNAAADTTIAVTDGSAIATVKVTSPLVCP